MDHKDDTYYNRGFLNKEPGSGMFETKISITEADEYSGSYFDCSLLIKDCYRQIELDFDILSDKSRENTLHKIDILMKELTTIRKYAESYKQKPKKKKKKEKKDGKKSTPKD